MDPDDALFASPYADEPLDDYAPDTLSYDSLLSPVAAPLMPEIEGAAEAEFQALNLPSCEVREGVLYLDGVAVAQFDRLKTDVPVEL